MSKKIMMIVALTIVALLAVPLAPAGAASAFGTAFLGKAHLSSPIGYPGLGINKGATIPFVFGAGSSSLPGSTQPTACVGAVAGKLNEAGACGIAAAGNIGPNPVVSTAGPWCGHSTGVFGGTVTMKPSGNTVSFNGNYISAGSLLIVNGTAQRGGQVGPFVAVTNATPDATKGDSCSTGADDFLVAGVTAGAIA